MLFEEFAKKEVFPYERPAWAGKPPEFQFGAGEGLIKDYEMPRYISTPDNVLMRDQFWDTFYKPGPGIPYPVIDSQPGASKLSPKHWNATDWREFFSPVIFSYIASKPLGQKFRPLTAAMFILPFGTYWASRNVHRRLIGEAYNRNEFQKYVGVVPEVEEYYDKVQEFKKNSYYHNLFTWRAVEMQLGWDIDPPSWYTKKVSKTLNDILSYDFN